MKTLLRFVFIALLCVLCMGVTKSRVLANVPDKAGALEVTYLANEGFMIAGGGKKVLVDALFREGVAGYAVISPTTRELLEQARAPFDNVDAAFATHFHADHFDAEAVLAHLKNNPQSFFFSTNQAADKLRATGRFEAIKTRVTAALPKEGERFHYEHRDLRVQLLNLHHGRNRPIENLGFIVEIGGKRILHIGDSVAEAAVFQKYEVAKQSIDVAFLPFWYFFNDDFKRAVREQIRPRHIVVMHIELDSFRNGSWQKKWAQIETEFPNAVYFAQELEKKILTEKNMSKQFRPSFCFVLMSSMTSSKARTSKALPCAG